MLNWRTSKIVLVFLNNSSLRVAEYTCTRQGAIQTNLEELFFPESVVKDSGILNSEEFAKSVSDFLAAKPKWKKLETLLVIPEEKVFLKSFELELGDLERKNEFRDIFISEIPFLKDDLIVQEHLAGKILELSAVHKEFAKNFQRPFIENGIRIKGMISIPQAMALDLQPKEKTFLLAFYDNDVALILAQNARVIFSETERISDQKVQAVVDVFENFVTHLKSEGIKSISLILGEEAIEEELRASLEQRGYKVNEIRKIKILDFIGEYYRQNKDKSKEWDLLFLQPLGVRPMLKKMRNYFVGVGIVIFLVALGVAVWRLYPLYQPVEEIKGVEELPIVTPTTMPEVALPTEATTTLETPTPATAPKIEVKKADYPIKIFNGTFVAGEAGRLRTVLQNNGFTVISTGNNENQNQTLTTIFIGSNTPEQITSELRLLLEKTYQSVVVSASPVVVGDIHIVIGRKK
jgi:hypothetical protein